MQFIDECLIYVKAGDGGDGSAAFRREAHRPRGGPAGGDGGNGGSIVFVSDPQLTTLLDFRYQREYRGERGEHGQGRDRYGKSGQDRVLKVPLGTVVKDEGGEILCDLKEAGQTFVAAQGGKGGRGNIHFATSTNQAPKEAEPGTPGQERTLRLELKLLADVGLLGYPNVGKSTLISRVSRARPKIADYPFTTLVPNLGVVSLPLGSHSGEGDRSFVLADVPGLIEGAHKGHGLGLRFLRHLSRARVLIHLLEVPLGTELEAPPESLESHPQEAPRSPLKDFDALNAELAHYDPALAQRPQLVALAKIDVTETRALWPSLKQEFEKRGVRLYGISAVTGEGVAELMEAAHKMVISATSRASEKD